MKKLLFICLPFVMTCCIIYSPALRGDGMIITEERPVSSFDKIDIRGSASVRFHLSKEYRLTVSVDSNLSKYFETTTRNNTLLIETVNEMGRSVRFTKNIVDIYCPDISSVSIEGSGSFQTIDLLKVSTFKVKIRGSGNISVEGSCGDIDINIQGSGRIDGDEFLANNAYVKIKGSGNVNIWAKDNLRGDISGSGTMAYKGNPKVDFNISGSGKIKKVE